MLFVHELKKTVCSVSYFLFVALITLALYSQGALDFSGDLMQKPRPGGNYGSKNEEIPEIIMPAALQALYGEFVENHYKTYPIGLYKNVRLNAGEQAEIAEILSGLTGLGKDVFLDAQNIAESGGGGGFVIMGGDIQSDGNGGFIVSPGGAGPQDGAVAAEPELQVRSGLSYQEFKEQMQRVDNILGGGSDYAEESLIGFGTVPLSYEEASARYELAVNSDRVTGGYARLFSDYAVAMVLGIFPVFPAVIMGMRDRRAKMSELVYVREESGARIVLMRYLAVIVSVMVPVIILSYLSNASVWGCYEGIKLDYLAPLKYALGWILPSVMISSALGLCLTELTGTPIAIAVQGLWWFLDINMGYKSVSASYALLRLSPRHNAGPLSYFRTGDFLDNFRRLWVNRLFFAVLSAAVVVVTIIIYEARRRGRLNAGSQIKRAFAHVGKGSFHRENQPEA